MTEKKGFQEQKVSFEYSETRTSASPLAKSKFAYSDALNHIQLIQLNDGEGSILYYPSKHGTNVGNPLEVGDVLFLREKENGDNEGSKDENGVITQVISLGTANYPHSQTKALFRVMVDVRATTLNRSHNEPPETIDQLLEAVFKVRASVVNGKWGPPEGRVVTRNVDIFLLNPAVLAKHIFDKINQSRFTKQQHEELYKKFKNQKAYIDQNTKALSINSTTKNHYISTAVVNEAEGFKEALSEKSLDIKLGHYKTEPVEFFGGGLEKINLITGMKGGGKSHIAKGIISESLKGGMSAVVFDINSEYGGISPVDPLVPGLNLKFRLDRIKPATFLQFVDRIAPFAERTRFIANSYLPSLLSTRDKIPDIQFLRSQSDNIFSGNSEPVRNMKASYTTALDIIENSKLIMTQAEAKTEDKFIGGTLNTAPSVISLSSALYNIEHDIEAGVIIFNIGGLLKHVQFSVVDMVLDSLKDICSKQTSQVKANKRSVPNYPTIFFEEAHMYMEPRVIDELLPLIRHFGMNVFFITNTPVALPDSVFRLIDNLFMTRILNKRDIDQVKNCGLADVDTIEGFATNLKEHHALLLSGLKGATKNFPLVFKVRDFNLPPSGETKSMWGALRNVVQ